MSQAQLGGNEPPAQPHPRPAPKKDAKTDYFVAFFEKVCPFMVPDGKRKTLIVRLGTAMVVPVALAGGLYWYYVQKGHSERMRQYHKKLEAMYDEYDYYDGEDEPSWSSSSWIMLLICIGMVIAYAFRSLILKGNNQQAQQFGNQGVVGEGLRQWAPQAGVPPQPSPFLPPQPPPQPPQHQHPPNNAGDRGPQPQGLRLAQDPPNIMNQDFHQRRMGQLGAAASSASSSSNSTPGIGARMRFQPSPYTSAQGGF